MTLQFLTPHWPAPGRVRAAVTMRGGGVSAPPWQGLNLGLHVGDAPAAVATNRQLVRQSLGLPREPLWLQQVHGVQVLTLTAATPQNSVADGVVSHTPGQVCAVISADCLPVLFCDRAGTVVGAAHAGWRGLAAGVLRTTLAAMAVPPAEVLAWLGPAIGPQHFEVGDEVRQAMLDSAFDRAQRNSVMVCFRPSPAPSLTSTQRAPDPHGTETSPTQKWMADIYGLARVELASLGVRAVTGGGLCTVSDASRWYSYRRDGVTGRMASLIWLSPV